MTASDEIKKASGIPSSIKIYHIVHVDKLHSILTDKYLWSDAVIRRRPSTGTTIGMTRIKERRLHKTLLSYPDLCVGECVPFYFCPRSVMLYTLSKQNDPSLPYQGGQEPIVHLEADLHASVEWARQENKRWVFTLSNAGSSYFEERSDLSDLRDIDWQAVHARQWKDHKEKKQAEFLMEHSFPWTLFERIGVFSEDVLHRVSHLLRADHPRVEIIKEWYYERGER